ncbi:LOW QUALITY PROTEIN: E3 ubiquitin ligase PQT3-like [Salvia miltiorrhiza]|uniref:LOW QUALITY PROTEIN: E3 ubiquitin ligase PQT3-like n=1 Tax=Salvia miltiorrhiza TaxID=226208 RepID=UPI0025AD4A33|nr:LOW QUALITY PROTEIN: E3 ubiquitin ligase PQT3-like [Salvia miltiorrhiza]
MAVYYKFKSAKDYDSVPMDGHFISVGHLKEKIFELKHLGGTDFDLIVTNAQTNEEYLDEGMLIPKNTSVLIRRVPGRPRKPIVTAPVSEQEELNVDHNSEDVQAVKGSFAVADQSYVKYGEDLEWDEFGNDLYAMPESTPVPSSIPIQDATPVSKEDEESKIKALIDTPALDWQRQPSDGFNGRGFARGGRMPGGRGGFVRGGFEKKTPPQGYICHRCKVPGHFIQHCPTNGDPNFDIRRVKPATGIPKSMLVATPDGSYAMASGLAATLKPNEAAFEKEIEGMPSTRSIGDLPRELRCPLCQEVMKDAVLASKCCLKSFCDKCIRDHIMSRSMCECGATSILADDLLPNKTLRDTINRILESNNNSGENGGSAFQAQDMESRNPQAKVPSPTQSAASKGQQVPAPPPQRQEVPTVVETVEENKPAIIPLKSEKGIALKVPDASEATHDSRTVKEAASQGSAPLADEEVQQKPLSGEAGRKKKKKKIRMAPGAAEMQWRTGPDLAPENYMMTMGPSAFNPGWNGMQPGFDGFMPYGGGPMPYGGYGVNHMDVQFGGFLPYDPFAGHGGILSYGPQRDLSELVGYNAPPPVMSREEFEARKADLKRKREMERREERDFSKDREYGREGSSTVNVSSRSKSRLTPPPSAADHRLPSRNRHSPERRSRDPELPRPSSKKKSDYEHDDHHHQQRRREYHEETNRDKDHHRSSSSSHLRRSQSPTEAAAAAEKKQKASVFSRISFPAGGESATKKRKASSTDVAAASHRSSNGQHEEHKAATGSRKGGSAAVSVDHDSSDDERHFKRRPSRYTSSPPPAASAEEEHRHSRRERDRGVYSSSSSKRR